MRKLTTLLLAGLCAGALPDEVQATPESRSAPLVLLIAPGSRAIAMGNSYVAMADDATASYFNPAALAGQSKKKIHLSHTAWLPKLADDLSYEFLAYSQPVEGWGNIGFNITFFNLGGQTRTNERGDIIGKFNSYDMALSAAYGAQIGANISAGIGLKFIYSHLAEVGAGKEKGEGHGQQFCRGSGGFVEARPQPQLWRGPAQPRPQDRLYRRRAGRSAAPAHRRRGGLRRDGYPIQRPADLF